MLRRRSRDSLALVLGAAVFAPHAAGCAGVSKVTRHAARDALLAVRPDADLDGVEIHVLGYWSDPGSYLDRSQDDLARYRRPIYEETVGVLTIAGLLEEKDLAKVEEHFVSIDVIGHSGVTLPQQGIIFLHPDHAESVPVLVHELAHIASERKGYPDVENARVFLRPAGRPDPRFVDVDALLALKILMEADAEFTELAAIAQREGGANALAELWKKPFPSDPPSGYGPLRIVSPEGIVVELGPGEPYYPALDLVRALQRISYEGSLALVQARHLEAEPLEETLRRMWSEFSYTTRELLFPLERTARSRLAELARGLEGKVSGALRVGTFLVWEMLKKKTRLSRKEATALSKAIVDDVLLREGDEDFCWVSEWTDETSAEKFAELYRGILRHGSVANHGRRVVASVGMSCDALHR